MDAPGTSRIRAWQSRRNHQQGPQVNITRDVTGSPAEVKEGSGIVTRLSEVGHFIFVHIPYCVNVKLQCAV
ncbi:hypothetical protein RHMOL_Rhmol11G0092100 [Rhododendron molle]|uniref:Uncharacterized protein n=1 Tax=Rhododendron molle TaxID=49168 RepID=A0ACC0LR87_RHOML|nr:hypothetical protein RHMOL_Rhmol11G0092100 [Rhododendron molle]